MRLTTPKFLDELAWRGLLYQTAGAGIEEHVALPGRVGYCGFDPTSDSLTVGNFVPIKLLMHWQRCGHTPIVLMGGGTGLIGDPSGKDDERQLLTRDEVEANIQSQRRIYERYLDFDPGNPAAAVIVNNLDWLGELRFLDVLREVGKHFSVNVMMQKDSVKQRLESRDHGISYTEFSYMILQAYDFLHLRRTKGCTVQVAGSDQYGNVIEGMDLIRREFGAEEGRAFGVTAPLLMRSDGKKFGKSEDGAIWLTPDRTSPYRFYQFWVNTDDGDVIAYLKSLTFLEREAIDAIAEEREKAPHLRMAQKTLAASLTELIHGRDELRKVEKASEVLFGGGDVRELDADLLAEVAADVPSSTHDRSLLSGEGLSLVDLLPQTTLASSKREAREFLGNGAILVNGERAGVDRRLRTEDLVEGAVVFLRRGKRNWHATLWR